MLPQTFTSDRYNNLDILSLLEIFGENGMGQAVPGTWQIEGFHFNYFALPISRAIYTSFFYVLFYITCMAFSFGLGVPHRGV
jgi:hypothetical protein